MTPHYHALVWIDHREAKVFQFDATDVDHSTVQSTHPHQHLHHKANSGDSGHAPLDKEFLKHVAQAVPGDAILQDAQFDREAGATGKATNQRLQHLALAPQVQWAAGRGQTEQG